MRRIDSTQNPQVKTWTTLHRRRDRDRHGRCIVEGQREISRAVSGGVKFTTILLGDGAASAEQELAAHIVDDGADGFSLSDAALSKVSVRNSPAQIIGIVRTPEFSLETLVVPDRPLILIADTIEKPGNLGAMIRSADGAGADAVIATDPISDVANPNVIRSSQGALFESPVATGSVAEVQAWLTANDIAAVAASDDANTELWDFDFTASIAIVIGSERSGISPGWQRIPRIAIPMAGVSDSLNASVAAAVLLYEARRQRR